MTNKLEPRGWEGWGHSHPVTVWRSPCRQNCLTCVSADRHIPEGAVTDTAVFSHLWLLVSSKINYSSSPAACQHTLPQPDALKYARQPQWWLILHLVSALKNNPTTTATRFSPSESPHLVLRWPRPLRPVCPLPARPLGRRKRTSRDTWDILTLTGCDSDSLLSVQQLSFFTVMGKGADWELPSHGRAVCVWLHIRIRLMCWYQDSSTLTLLIPL